VRTALPRLHAITDERVARRADIDRVARALSEGGGADLALHARGHSLTGREHYDLAFRLSVLPSPLFVNDRLDVALAVPAAGVQLGSASLSVSAARDLEPRWWIGRSVHDLGEAEAARTEGADYLVLGPVYRSATHADREPLGLDALRRIVALGLPVVAIGGITVERVREVRDAGAHGIAAIRAFWDDSDPAGVAGQMREKLI
jgi:thiamine-phosphate diphosphorylase